MAQTAEPQAILVTPTEAAIFLVLVVHDGGENVVRDLLGDVGGLVRSVAFRIPDGGLGCVAGAAGIARASDYVRAFPDQIALLLSAPVG